MKAVSSYNRIVLPPKTAYCNRPKQLAVISS